MRSAERRRAIRELAARRPVGVEELSAHFGVSPSTVRRDLAELTADGELVRTYGGAVASSAEQPLHARERLALAQKAAIARVAERYVTGGATLALDAGTTVGGLARRLAASTGLTVVTNGLTSIDALADAEDVRLVVLGGTVRHISLGMVGPVAERTMRDVTVDAAFLGADGVDAERGVCEATAEQASLKRLMAEQATSVYVLADHSKLRNPASHWWTPLDRPWTLITDDEAGPEHLAPFRDHPEITVVVASTTDNPAR